MIKKQYADFDVVTASKQRIKNIFETSNKVQMSVSGGKDSICLNDLVFKMCVSGEIDKSKLVIDFIDEEAIYPCVVESVKSMRLQWMSIGVEFRWWCVEVRHFNCFNQLTNDESFICWDRYKKDVWVRPMPPWGITDHPLLKKRQDTYQMFLPKVNADRVCMIGIRVEESMQRAHNIANQSAQARLYPIYDWSTKDVWLYIKENNLEFPKAYIYMYQVGVSIRRLRLSQFFSVDVAGSLVKMCEFYPELFDKICKREPNAYMAMLYYDTEMFRRSKERNQVQKDDEIDYRAKALEVLSDDSRFPTKNRKTQQKEYKRMVMMHGAMIDNKTWKLIYNALVGGDPKKRAFRAIFNSIFIKIKEMEEIR